LIKTKNKKDKWIKLICGASNEDIVAIEDLCAIYTAAGVDYIDVAAEESIVYAAKKKESIGQKKSLKTPLD
jgi:effector-binding domain-containing protein